MTSAGAFSKIERDMVWIKLNTPVKLYTPIITQNYYAPLTSRVDTLERANIIFTRPAPQQHQQQQQQHGSPTNSSKTLSVRCKAKPPLVAVKRLHKQGKRMHFSLPANHTDKNSTEWRRQWEKPTSKKLRRLLKDKLRSGVLDGSIPSAASDTGATASAFKPSAPTIPTCIKSNTSFGGAFGDITEATTVKKPRHKLREPARSEHIVPDVKDSLLSTSKMVDADYIAVYDKEEVNFYDAKTTKRVLTEEAVLTRYRCPKVGLWRLPLVENPTNLNTDTLILDHRSPNQA